MDTIERFGLAWLGQFSGNPIKNSQHIVVDLFTERD